MRWTVALAFAACTQDPERTDDKPDDTDDPTTSSPPTETVRASRFDDVADTLERELGDQLYASGVSIAVLEQGELTWVEAFGSAVPGGDRPITPDMRFQIGSTTKQMTAALVLAQVDQGVLSLDDTVAELLPNVSLAGNPTWADEATLELLLSHQGGMRDFIDWSGPPEDSALQIWHETFFSSELWLNNPPGAFWNYSNPNFSVAGLAAETHDTAGRSYADMLVEDLFAPLGMTHTVARKADVERPYVASHGLHVDSYDLGSLSMEEVANPASARPAGLVWSTPVDMTLWGSFLLHGDPTVLSDELRGRITTPEVSTLYFEDHVTYGLGVFLWDRYVSPTGFYPMTIWEHGGNTLSMTSAFYVLPEHDVVISILSNGYGDVFDETWDALLRVVVDPFPAPTTNDVPEIDPDVFALHVGSYLDPNVVGAIEITEGGQFGLEIAIPDIDLETTDLIPATNDFWYFQLGPQPFDVTFVRDPGGGPTPWLRNRSFVGGRVPDVVARAAPLPGRERAGHNDPSLLEFLPPPTRLPPPRLP